LTDGRVTDGQTVESQAAPGRVEPDERTEPAESSALAGRVAVVTGAGAGLGRAEALALAAAGANLVINDVRPEAAAVVDEIVGLGVKAVLVVGDIGESSVATDLVRTAVDSFGRLDVVVNNAGLLRDRMLFSLSDEDWDLVVRVHLRGHFLLSRNAAAYWRDTAKAGTGTVYGRLVNTASEAWLFGSPGQANYAAAKAGIAALTVSAARSLHRYGVRANVICPRARTEMTAGVFGPPPDGTVDPLSVDHVAPFVAYLAGPSAETINGQVFIVHGGSVALVAPPTVAQRFTGPPSGWTRASLDASVGDYFAGRPVDDVFALTETLSVP
jgi:NAD(P)-dependent dehydrogenase (short-subunit alcohol dehydrogenase family)